MWIMVEKGLVKEFVPASFEMFKQIKILDM